MKTNTLFLVLTVLLSFGLVGCDPKPLPNVVGIQCSLDEGAFISDDIYFTNSAGKDLTEVHFTMTLTGENGVSKKFTRYWASWHLGDKQHISLSLSESVVKIQRIDISGTCDQGSITDSWVKK